MPERANSADAAEGGQYHRVAERELVDLADTAVVADLFHGQFSGVRGGHPRAGDPFDVALTQLAFQETLGVADAVEAEVADIGLRGNEGHGDAVA